MPSLRATILLFNDKCSPYNLASKCKRATLLAPRNALLSNADAWTPEASISQLFGLLAPSQVLPMGMNSRKKRKARAFLCLLCLEQHCVAGLPLGGPGLGLCLTSSPRPMSLGTALVSCSGYFWVTPVFCLFFQLFNTWAINSVFNSVLNTQG